MEKKTKRPLGRILVEGGFVSGRDLNLALLEQARTSELLGHVLVNMGVLDEAEVKAALSIQDCLASPGTAVLLAAGVRKTLGDLLVQAGHITTQQLEHGLAEQKRTGGKMGDVFIRLGLLSERQLDHVLDFQRRQAGTDCQPSKLRLGEILVSAGHITRAQLDDALQKHKASGKKLGETLVEEGYIEDRHVKRGLRIQHMLLTVALIAAVSLGGMTGCGGGGSGQPGSTASNVQTIAPSPDVNAPVELDLSSCRQTATGGARVIHVPAGVYTVSKTIELPSNTILEGAGESTVFTSGAEFNGSLFIKNEDFVHGNKNIVLRNMQIRFTSPQLIGVLRFYKVEDVVISNITMVVDSPMYAVDLSGQVRSATIEGCTISNANKASGGGIMIRNSDPLPAPSTSDITVSGNNITSVSDEPIAAFGWEGMVENVRIEDNTVQAADASFGISAYGHNSPGQGGQIKGVEIVENVITGGNHGAIGVMGGAEDVVVTGNQVGETAADGIFLHQGGDGLPSVQDVKVSQNSIRNAGRHGIFAAGQGVVVEQNVLDTCGGGGVWAAAGVLVIDNSISNASPGILVDGGQQSDIKGNRLYNDDRILFVNSDGSTVTVLSGS